MQTALLHHQKAEQKRIHKRDHMRKKRAKQKPPGGSFAGPLSKVHLNSLDSPTLTQEEKVNRKKMQDRVNLQRRRLKQRLLSPSYSLCHHEDMNRVNSWFALHADDTEYILHLPPWELYSTKLASVYLHAREVLDKTGRKGPSRLPDELQDNPHDKKWVEIPPDVTEFLDFENDLLHVVQCGSPLLDRVASNRLLKDPIYRNGLLDVNFSIIVNALLSTQIGSGDIKRAPDSIRVSFGFNEYSSPTSFGNVDKLLGQSNAKAFKREVGRIAEFLCATMIFLQFASDNKPIWTSSDRDAGFAAVIRNRLHLPQISPMRAEMVVASLMPLTKSRPFNKTHTDPKNPRTPGYDRNGTFSAVLKGEDGHLYLLQVLVASRKYATKLGKKGLL